MEKNYISLNENEGVRGQINEISFLVSLSRYIDDLTVEMHFTLFLKLLFPRLCILRLFL